MSSKKSSVKKSQLSKRKQSNENDLKSNENLVGLTDHSKEDNTTKKLTTAEQLELYLNVLKDDDLSKLPQDKVLEMRKRVNPYGRTIAGSDKYLNFSITQISHEYWKKFLTTAMIGFLYRMNNEWKVPAGVPVVSVYDYLDDNKLLDTPEVIVKKGHEPTLYDYEFNRKWMEKRLIVAEFLEEMFQFNPDEGVASAYRPNYKDKTRNPLNTMAARIAVKHACAKDSNLRDEKSRYDDSIGIKKKKVKKTIKGKDGKIKVVVKEVLVNEPPVKKPEKIHSDKLDEKAPVDPNVKDTTTNFIPPTDMFHRFKMYYTENYEELREVVNDLYCEKPDLELAINPYAWHNTPEEAESFKKQHADEVIAEIFTAHSGKWNFFDTFKEQRESVNFYNKNTVILEEMVKQIERDERLGQDLMAKRVEKEKKKNIIEAGPDAETFRKWREENTELQKLGAKHIGSMADEDCPDDAIEVPVWRVAKGGLELTRDKFYSKAEAPKFVKEAQDKARFGGTPSGENIPTAPAVEPRSDNL
jgi:hypothetical protein